MSESSSSSTDLTRSVTLKRSEIEEYIEGRTQGYRVRFDVLEAVCMPAELFVYQRVLGSVPGTVIDTFSNVASPTDLEEYPTDEPTDAVGFYRLSHVDLIFRSIDLLSQSAQDLTRDISALVMALNQLDVLIEHDVTLTGIENSVDLLTESTTEG